MDYEHITFSGELRDALHDAAKRCEKPAPPKAELFASFDETEKVPWRPSQRCELLFTTLK
jgi:hypothetical protein